VVVVVVVVVVVTVVLVYRDIVVVGLCKQVDQEGHHGGLRGK
jgi:hypothetical protein